jgi:hypothetical protein
MSTNYKIAHKLYVRNDGNEGKWGKNTETKEDPLKPLFYLDIWSRLN